MGKGSLLLVSLPLVIVSLFLITFSLAEGSLQDSRAGSFPLFPAADRRSPRGGKKDGPPFGGLHLMCQVHQRNCPGGFRKRFSRLITAKDLTSLQETPRLTLSSPPGATGAGPVGELPPLPALLLARTPVKMAAVAAAEEEVEAEVEARRRSSTGMHRATMAAVRLSSLLDRLRQRLVVISGGQR